MSAVDHQHMITCQPSGRRAAVDAAIERRIAELLPQLPPLTDDDCHLGAAILAAAQPDGRTTPAKSLKAAG